MKASSVLPSSSMIFAKPRASAASVPGLQRHEQVGLLSDGVLVGVDDDELAIVILNRVGDVVPGVRPGHDGLWPHTTKVLIWETRSMSAPP